MTTTENPETVDDGSGSPEGVTQYELNAALRKQWLELIADANDSDDPQTSARLREEAARVADEFVRANRGLAYAGASPLLHADSHADREDHTQAAMMGLWEAFVGTDPEALERIHRDEDGTVHAPDGWDTDRATFGTVSRAHIRGRVMRSARTETATSHLSYGQWSQRPKVKAARDELVKEGIPRPSYEQIARRAQVSVETVRLVLMPSAVSMDTPLGEDSDSTVADLIAARPSLGSSGDGAELLEKVLVQVAQDERTRADDLICYLLTSGAMGRERTVMQTAALTGIGRGQVGSGTKRITTALEARVEEIVANLRA